MGHLAGCECLEHGCPVGLHGCTCQARRASIVINYLRAGQMVNLPSSSFRAIGLIR